MRPDSKRGNWSHVEEFILTQAHSEQGGQWCRISKLLPGEHATMDHLPSFLAACTLAVCSLLSRLVLALIIDQSSMCSPAVQAGVIMA